MSVINYFFPNKGEHYLISDGETIVEIIDPSISTQIVVKTISGPYDPRRQDPHRNNEWTLQTYHLIKKV